MVIVNGVTDGRWAKNDEKSSPLETEGEIKYILHTNQTWIVDSGLQCYLQILHTPHGQVLLVSLCEVDTSVQSSEP